VLVPEPLPSPTCTFGPDKGELPSSLVFTVAGQRFATLRGTVTVERLEIAEGNQRAYAIVDDGRVKLAAEVVPGTIRLAPRDDQPIDGWLEVRAARIAEAAGGRIRLGIDLPRRFTPITPPAIERACAELRPVTSMREASHSPYARLVPDRRVPFAARPGGPPVGHLFRSKPKPHPLHPHVVEAESFSLQMRRLGERGSQAQVRVTGGLTSVVGWVPKTAITSANVGMLGMLGGPSGGGPRVSCGQDVDLIVASAAGRHRVGQLHAGAAVPADVDADGNILVRLSDSSLDDVFAKKGEESIRPRIAADQAKRCSVE